MSDRSLTAGVPVDLTGRTAFITGGGGGLGRAIALCMAGCGADVAILDVVPERCDETAERVAELGRRCLKLPCDVMNVPGLTEAVRLAAEHFGTLDILVNNAGGTRPIPFLEMTERNWRRHIDLNLVSVLAATLAAAPFLANGGRGAVINVTSIEGSRAFPGGAVYGACKAAVNNLTRTLALELADRRIRVNAIAPDYIVTPGLRGNISGPVDEATWIQPPPSHEEAVRRRTPLGRTGVDVECGKLAAFLASDAASYITGTIIPVDGGTWAAGGWIRASNDAWILPPEI